ncbi:SDR family NAD(P)-dependent oxidoreductase [Mesobacillus harenae]|uniref:SDR family NAD(P)-dependent oxidoreductase n=1 Tax=Mesobacillus harenae TaxID=2213203 RepID=UPI0015810BB9|nr:SDR family oxidoreductase [Mesobacillus harenae]
MESVIVTGAGSGLGKELAVLLAGQGYHIILTGRTEANLKITQKLIQHAGNHADVLVLDIRNKEDIKDKFLQIDNQYNLLGLINNAGVGYFGPFEQGTESQIEEVFNTNVFGTMSMTKAVLPYLSKAGRGFVMNIISTAGLRGKKDEAIYAASKFAVRGFTESLQKEYEGSAIRFIPVYMGGMNTPFWDSSSHVDNPSKLRSPREVAKLILDNMDNDTITIESKRP